MKNTTFIIVWALWALLSLAIPAAIIYAVVHFVLKFW